MSKAKKILWVDLEMTGLDPVRDEILEVAAIATDWNFKEIATYEGIVRHDSEKLAKLLDRNAGFGMSIRKRDAGWRSRMNRASLWRK